MKQVRRAASITLATILALTFALQFSGHLWWRSNQVWTTWGLDVGVLSRSYSHRGVLLVNLPIYGDSTFLAYPKQRKVAVMDSSRIFMTPFFAVTKDPWERLFPTDKLNLANNFTIEGSNVIEFKSGVGIFQIWSQ